MLAQAKNLRWMQATEAGMEHVLFPELIKSNVVVTNMARMFAPALGDTAQSDAVEPDARAHQDLHSAVPEAGVATATSTRWRSLA